eukprot:Gb_36890 [translate_table: standard]
MGGHSSPKSIVQDYFRVRKERPGQAALAIPLSSTPKKKIFSLNLKSVTPPKSPHSGHRECLCDSASSRKPPLHKGCIIKPQDREQVEGFAENGRANSIGGESRAISDKPWVSDTLSFAKRYEVRCPSRIEGFSFDNYLQWPLPFNFTPMAVSNPGEASSTISHPDQCACGIQRLVCKLSHASYAEFQVGDIKGRVAAEDLVHWSHPKNPYKQYHVRPTRGNILKLAETLSKFRADPDNPDENSDVLRTGACWKILYEICEEKLPFAKVLHQIYDELQHALYSKNEGSPDQKIPYFVIVKQMEKQMAKMDTENNNWCTALVSHQSGITIIGEQMKDLKDLVFEAESTSKELEGKIEATVGAIDSEKSKVRKLRNKLTSMRQELKEISAGAQYSTPNEEHQKYSTEEYEKLKALYMQLTHQFQYAQSALQSAQCEVAQSVPKTKLIAAKAKILDLESKLMRTKSQINNFIFDNEHKTPRPQWGKLHERTLKLSTAEQVDKICRENAFLVENLSRLQTHCAASQAALAEVKQNVQAGGKKKEKCNSKPKETLED